MTPSHARLDRVTEALNHLAVAADEAITAFRAVPVSEDDATLVDLLRIRKRIASQAGSSSVNQGVSTAAPPPPLSSHGPSTLLKLPVEIRNQIYKCLFASTRLTSGTRSLDRISCQKKKPAPNSLAILRTCRQVNQEVGAIWLSEILFNFEEVEGMLDKLSCLPSTTLSQIRHVRVGGRPLMLQPIGDNDDVYYRLAWALKLLPDLCLDRLTVLGSRQAEIAYDTLEGLIKYGDGWKELHFITPNSNMLGFSKINMFMMDPYWRKPQPSTWNEILLKRDGANSGASVTIYRAAQPDAPGAVLHPHRRQVFEQRPSRKNLKNFGVKEDRELLSGNEAHKELLVVVKRGRRAQIMEQDSPPYLSGHDIRQWAYGLTWAEIRRECIDFIDKSEDEDLFPEEVEADVYNMVDEYMWSPVD